MTQTPDQTAARETLTHLARTRAEYSRGGSTNFQQSHEPQIRVALRASGMTSEAWESLCTQAEVEEAEQWRQKLIDADEAAAELVLERRRNR